MPRSRLAMSRSVASARVVANIHNGSMYPYSVTYADVGAAPSNVCWRLLRALRADPPINADGERRETFAAALEQSEQLFSAASTVGPATRPILLFYGLSQAGRALVAARAAPGDSWKLSGHGIKQGRGIRRGAVADAQVAPDSRPAGSGREDNGSFTRIVEVLGSSTLPGPTRLGDLWPLIRPAYKFPLPNSGDHRLVPISMSPGRTATSTERVKVELSGLPSELHYAETGTVDGVRGDWGQQTDAVFAFLSSYPTLSDLVSAVPHGQPIAVRRDTNTGQAAVALYLRNEFHSQFATHEDLERYVAFRDAGHVCAYPALDGTARPIHPLVVWWSVLFGLSMLARYEPEQWARAIDVNESSEAVPIEHLLQAGLDHLPELVHRTLVGLA